MIEAVQWFIEGDLKVVTMYKDDMQAGHDRICVGCKNRMGVHGLCPTLEGRHIVCPGDWIITGVNGEQYPCKPDIFEKTYERVS